MSEKPQIDRNQVWMIVMIASSVTILMNASRVFAPEGGWAQTIYSALFAGLGGIIGLVAYALTKDRSTTYKVIGIIVLLLVASAILLFAQTYQ